MGIFSRLFRMGKAEVNHALDQMEDPVKMTEEGIRELREKLELAIKALAEIKATATRSKNELEKAKQSAADYQNKAMMLLQRAQSGAISQQEADRLATMALQKKSEIISTVPQLEQNYNRYQADVTKLENTVKDLKSNIEKYTNEAKVLKARAKVSEATVTVNKELAGIDASSTVAMLERMKEKVEQQEALADSYLDIAESNRSTDNEIDNALGGSRMLEASSDLEALKAQLAAGSNAIGASSSTEEASEQAGIDLEALKNKMAQKAQEEGQQAPME